MKYPGFIGPTYSGRSVTPAGDRTINLYVESNKGAGAPESNYNLLGTPGTALFASLPGKLQGIYAEPATGRVFAVASSKLYEVKQDGSNTLLGTIGTGYYTFASNSQQVMISCAGDATGWILTLSSGTLAQITVAGFIGTSQCVMIDNYFISLVPNSRKFQISSLLDGTQWDALDFSLAEGGADNLTGMVTDHRELWLFGSRRGEIFVDSGAANFPFERINSTYVEQGLAAPRSAIQLDNTIYWLGQNQHGQARVFRASGYIPQGVSNRSVEYFFNQYAKHGGISDAVAYGYQDESGHTFYVLSFPSATCEFSPTGETVTGVVKGATWVYDVTEDAWHERQSLKAGVFGKHAGLFHTFGLGKQLVGGGDDTGNIYELTTDVYQDNGSPIKRIRRAPHIVDEMKQITYGAFRLHAQVGVIPTGAADNAVVLRTSNDGGATWSNEYSKSLGEAGNYRQQLQWRRLGRAQRRSFEVSTTVNAPICFVDADLQVQEGF